MGNNTQMKRRDFLISSTLAALAPSQVFAAYQPTSFVMETWRNERSSSDLVILNFRASWSLTCDIKADLLDDIICSDDSYANLRILEVDWDTFGPSQMTQRMKITRHWTLVLLRRGQDEIARVVNKPYRRNIKAFLDTAVAAS